MKLLGAVIIGVTLLHAIFQLATGNIGAGLGLLGAGIFILVLGTTLRGSG